MSSIGRIGPSTPPPPESNPQQLGTAIDQYITVLTATEPNFTKIATETVQLSNLAHSVSSAASLGLKIAADDLEKVLRAPVSVPNITQQVSILTASQNYLDKSIAGELPALIDELHRNSLAFKLMQNELHLISEAIKNPSAPGS